ncbi:MAG: hypothetical protein ACLQO1_22150 [Steroidobacteraceae bacterium]
MSWNIAPAAAGPPQSSGGAEHFDNETPLVALAEETPAELGYEPSPSGSLPAQRRCTRSANHPERFDIVLTDESMPELAGTAFAGAVAGLHERARTLWICEVLLNHFSEKTSPNVSRACCQAER